MTHSSSLPLHRQNPLNRFSNRADEYAKYRPSYPPEAIDRILENLGSPCQPIMADMGAGTGISSRLVAWRGATVWAIEPNAAMREAATPHPRVEFRDGTAEQTGLSDQSVDVVLCCQSFHWFDKPVALAEFHRILKPGGRVALMWNDRNLEDEFTRVYSTLISQVAERQIFDRPDRKSGTVLEQSPLFTHFRAHTLFHTYRLNLDSLIGLALSASYIPKTGTAYEELIANLQALYQRSVEQSRDYVELSYRVILYIADRAS